MICGSRPRANSSPPLSNNSASASISIDRGRQGGNTSSTTNATLGCLPASRHFLVPAILCPPISIVSVSGLWRNPTGTTCGLPSTSTVAKRPRCCSLIYVSSFFVNMLILITPLIRCIYYYQCSRYAKQAHQEDG